MNTDITKQMEMVLYRTEDDNVTVSALIKDETIWLTQKAMAELFGIDKSGISRHLAKIFESGELDEEVVVAKIATTHCFNLSCRVIQRIQADTPLHHINMAAITSWYINTNHITDFV